MTCGKQHFAEDTWVYRNSNGVPILVGTPESDNPTLAQRFDTDEQRNYDDNEFSYYMIDGMVAHDNDEHHSDCELAIGGME